MTDWFDDYLKKKEQEEAEEKARREAEERAKREAEERARTRIEQERQTRDELKRQALERSRQPHREKLAAFHVRELHEPVQARWPGSWLGSPLTIWEERSSYRPDLALVLGYTGVHRHEENLYEKSEWERPTDWGYETMTSSRKIGTHWVSDSWINAIAVVIEDGSKWVPHNSESLFAYKEGIKYQYRDAIIFRSFRWYDHISFFSYWNFPTEGLMKIDMHQGKEDVMTKLKNLLAEDYRNRDFTSDSSDIKSNFQPDISSNSFKNPKYRNQTLVYLGERNPILPTETPPVLPTETPPAKKKSVLKRLKGLFRTQCL